MVQLPEEEVEVVLAGEEYVGGSDLLDEDDESEIFFEVVDSGENENERTNLIDAVVGKLEEILIDETFEERRLEFARENCQAFEDTEENKLVYTELFRAFSTLVEDALVQGMKADFPQFTVREVTPHEEASPLCLSF